MTPWRGILTEIVIVVSLTLLRNGMIIENDTAWDVDDWRRQCG